jgi:hypothetical protein
MFICLFIYLCPDTPPYEDVEFTVEPLGEIFKPEFKDWSLFCSVRDPNYQQRRGRALWLAEKKRWEAFVLGWFRDAEIPGSENFREGLEAKIWKTIEKWKEGELLGWSIEEGDPEEIRDQGVDRVERKTWKWAGKYWDSRQICQQIPREEFQRGASQVWRISTAERISYAVERTQEDHVNRRIRRDERNVPGLCGKTMGRYTGNEGFQDDRFSDNEGEGARD